MTFSSTSIINGAETATIPLSFPNPGPSFSKPDANLHTFSPSPHTPPPFARQARTLEQGKPRGNLPGDFEAPQYVKDPIQFVIFDFVSSGRALLSRRFVTTDCMATCKPADPGGSSAVMSVGLMPFCFGLYCELFRVPGIGESQFQAYSPSLVFCPLWCFANAIFGVA